MNPTLKVTDIFPGGQKISIIAFGRTPRRNLSLKGTTATEDLRKSHPDVHRALFSLPHIANYYAPAPDGMTGLVCEKDELGVIIPVTEYVNLHRGVDADGVYGLKSGEAFVMSSADCALIVVWAQDRYGVIHIIVAHAGRNSLYDANNPDRPSIVDNIAAHMMSKGVWPVELKVWIGLSISAGPHFTHNINDPRWPNNKKIVDYALGLGDCCVANNGTLQDPDYSQGWIDIKQIVRSQFVNLSTPPENITLDSVCTSTDTNPDGSHTWYSQSRGDSGRNLVIVRID